MLGQAKTGGGRQDGTPPREVFSHGSAAFFFTAIFQFYVGFRSSLPIEATSLHKGSYGVTRSAVARSTRPLAMGCMMRFKAAWPCATGLRHEDREGCEEGASTHAGNWETELLRPGSSARVPKPVEAVPRGARRRAGDARRDMAHGAE